MRTTMMRYAVGAGLGSMLALAAATGFGQIQTGTRAASQVTQYCVPSHDNPDAYRLYCGKEDGWSGPTGAVAFVCFMQGIEQGALSTAEPLRPCRIAMAAADRMH